MDAFVDFSLVYRFSVHCNYLIEILSHTPTRSGEIYEKVMLLEWWLIRTSQVVGRFNVRISSTGMEERTLQCARKRSFMLSKLSFRLVSKDRGGTERGMGFFAEFKRSNSKAIDTHTHTKTR
ncbi:hypothetical protein GYMLUDRAFT_394002 [Collybiopsis luxurians FD-317 M1]|uniref:Uncharacterized protein n=1 Tax=Collybiopsis luxurians FD-317 M1 TaxID=944289 RepID=A0A0D0AMN1_9AGAR|nr:hypothetical protein GYMLUDRAFT_394002 [Collybiopsis luxurians FD-317 M1]